MKLKTLLTLAMTLALGFTTALAAEDDTPLMKEMKAMNKSLRTLKRQVADATKKDENVTLIAGIKKNIDASMARFREREEAVHRHEHLRSEGDGQPFLRRIGHMQVGRDEHEGHIGLGRDHAEDEQLRLRQRADVLHDFGELRLGRELLIRTEQRPRPLLDLVKEMQNVPALHGLDDRRSLIGHRRANIAGAVGRVNGGKATRLVLVLLLVLDRANFEDEDE
jgi:hypothetical protein